jgi:DNA modification methylase
LGNAQNLPIESNYVDLIVTSPPYASNAIDYMRAHKFSLVWLGYDVDSLGRKRKKYIGGEATSDFLFKNMPHQTRIKVSEISEIDTKRGDVLLRYYSEMKATLLEMYRVLKPGKASIVVVGNSMMKGISTNTAECLKEIGEEVGFAVSEIGIRDLDRDRRMMPAGKEVNGKSQIQQRMHEEYVIGFWKARKGQI